MRENVVSIPAGDVRLAGVFASPSGNESFPAALLINGSGPLDRDGNFKSQRLNVSYDLAKLLAGIGWASLRFDKRGIGESGGDYLSTGMYEELDDADYALQWLRSRNDVSRAVAIGHSIGATMAAELAVRHPGLGGIVLLACTAKTGEETLTWQTQQMKDHILPAPVKALLKLFRTDVVTQQQKAVAKLKETTDDVARIQMAKVNAKWMREFIAYDPTETLRRVEVPTLAITGSKDVQVDPDDLSVIASLVERADVRSIDDVDHILRHEPAPVSNPRFYKKQISQPIDNRVTGLLIDWLERLEVD